MMTADTPHTPTTGYMHEAQRKSCRHHCQTDSEQSWQHGISKCNFSAYNILIKPYLLRKFTLNLFSSTSSSCPILLPRRNHCCCINLNICSPVHWLTFTPHSTYYYSAPQYSNNVSPAPLFNSLAPSPIPTNRHWHFYLSFILLLISWITVKSFTFQSVSTAPIPSKHRYNMCNMCTKKSPQLLPPPSLTLFPTHPTLLPKNHITFTSFLTSLTTLSSFSFS